MKWPFDVDKVVNGVTISYEAYEAFSVANYSELRLSTFEADGNHRSDGLVVVLENKHTDDITRLLTSKFEDLLAEWKDSWKDGLPEYKDVNEQKWPGYHGELLAEWKNEMMAKMLFEACVQWRVEIANLSYEQALEFDANTPEASHV